MGKNWMGNKRNNDNKNDLSSCRGYSVVIATCEPAREREGTKELNTLLLQEIEKIDAENAANNTTTTSIDNSSKSIQSLLEEELEEIRGQRHEATQQVMSINTGCKGLVLCKIKNKSLCPIDLVKRIFNRVKTEKQPISRWVSRLMPLTHVFFPNERELDSNIRLLLENKFPGILLPPPKEFDTDKRPKSTNDNNNDDNNNQIANSNADLQDIVNATDINDKADIKDDIAVGEKRTIDESNANTSTDNDVNVKKVCVENPYANQSTMYFGLQFKQRNHTVVTKNMTLEAFKRNSPEFLKSSYKYDMKVHFNIIVEVFMNLGGISYIGGDDDLIKADFNLRKLQTQLFGPPPEKVSNENKKDNKYKKTKHEMNNETKEETNDNQTKED